MLELIAAVLIESGWSEPEINDLLILAGLNDPQPVIVCHPQSGANYDWEFCRAHVEYTCEDCNDYVNSQCEWRAEVCNWSPELVADCTLEGLDLYAECSNGPDFSQ